LGLCWRVRGVLKVVLGFGGRGGWVMMKLDKIDLKYWEYIRLTDNSIGAIMKGTSRVMINNSKEHRAILDSKCRREGNVWYDDRDEVAEIKLGRVYTWVDIVTSVFGVVKS